MSPALPSRMQALLIKSDSGGAGSLALQEVPVPALGPGQVLIEVAAAPINPNDLLVLRNAYEVSKPFESVAGFEGSGRVVSARGWMGQALVGRRVAFAAAATSGAWAQYAVAQALQCAPLRGRISDAQGATMLTNPFTATVLIDQAMREGHRAIVQAAANGALGRMIARLGLRRRLTILHLVRGETAKRSMLELGVTHVLDSSTPDFESALSAACEELGVTLALDPVSGTMTGSLLRAVRPGGTVRIFGRLSHAPSSFDSLEVVFHGKHIDGFTMYDWVKRTSLLGKIATSMRVQGLLDGPLATEIRAQVGLGDYASALTNYERTMSGGKILFAPNQKGTV